MVIEALAKSYLKLVSLGSFLIIGIDPLKKPACVTTQTDLSGPCVIKSKTFFILFSICFHDSPPGGMKVYLSSSDIGSRRVLISDQDIPSQSPQFLSCSSVSETRGLFNSVDIIC